jgi:hypothetical protein
MDEETNVVDRSAGARAITTSCHRQLLKLN